MMKSKDLATVQYKIETLNKLVHTMRQVHRVISESPFDDGFGSGIPKDVLDFLDPKTLGDFIYPLLVDKYEEGLDKLEELGVEYVSPPRYQ